MGKKMLTRDKHGNQIYVDADESWVKREADELRKTSLTVADRPRRKSKGTKKRKCCS